MRRSTKHPDILTAFLSTAVTLFLYSLHHTDRQLFMYPMESPPCARYKVFEEYEAVVLEPNHFDLDNYIEKPDDQEIKLLEQRKRFRN